MLETVQGMLENFAEMVQRFGYVPGGGRVYQSKRSGPPLLIPTVLAYLEHSNDITLIRSLLPTLEREYDFWMTNRTVDIRGSDGSMHTLNRYHVLVGQSRPEAWRLDERTARSLPRGADPADFHSHVATAVESGWEFSSRWLADVGPQARTLASIRTRNIVPVDLNAMMCLSEVALARIYQRAGDRRKAGYYNSAAARRRVAMDKLLWSERRGAWFDYDLQAEGRRDRFYISNVWPLWAKCYGNGMGDANIEARVLSYLKQYTDVLNYTGGVPASLQESGQAWDYPYGAAPNHFVLIEALSVSQLTEAKNTALNLTRKWLETNYRDWVHTGAMWDKGLGTHWSHVGQGKATLTTQYRDWVHTGAMWDKGLGTHWSHAGQGKATLTTGTGCTLEPCGTSHVGQGKATLTTGTGYTLEHVGQGKATLTNYRDWVHTGAMWDKRLGTHWSHVGQGKATLTTGTGYTLEPCGTKDWVHTGAMWDKYNVITGRHPRHSDEEEDVKDGYGWTNGVALHLLDKYGNLLKAPDVSGSPDNHAPTALLLIGCLMTVLMTSI
ncbi:hypothetical protein Bbelb_129100 [Branchiostoma belcheri]|nr:hypothetical protein Bbelb_129100 [Branchiostoma belcheri]